MFENCGLWCNGRTRDVDWKTDCRVDPSVRVVACRPWENSGDKKRSAMTSN